MRAVIHFVDLARKKYGTPFPYPSISFDLRGVCAGKAYDQRNHIQLNAVLLIENTKRMCEETVPHEVAHLVTRHHFGPKQRPHGPEWQSVMHTLGVTPKRVHDMDVARARTGKTHAYACRCTTHEIGSRMHAAIRRGVVYRCRHCKTPLQAAPASLDRPGATSQGVTSVTVDAPWPARSGTGDASHPGWGGAAPTQRQLLYALAIARKKHVLLPVAVLHDRALLSRWIAENVA